MTEQAEVIEQASENSDQVARPLFIDAKGGKEEIGREEPPLTVQEGPLNEATQHSITALGDSFAGTLNELEWREGPNNMYQALAGIDKQPVLVDDNGLSVASVMNAQALLLALPHAGAVGPPKMRFLVAKTAGQAMHGKLVEAVPDLIVNGPDGLQEAPTLRGILSTVDLADGSQARVAAMYTYDFAQLEPQQVEQMLNTLKAHSILPVTCSVDMSVL